MEGVWTVSVVRACMRHRGRYIVEITEYVWGYRAEMKEHRRSLVPKRDSAPALYCWRFLTFCDSHCRPSNRPSPVVAQLQDIVRLRDSSNSRIETYLLTLGGHTMTYRAFGGDQASP